MTLRRTDHPFGNDTNPGSLSANGPILLVGGATATIRRIGLHPNLGRFTQPRSQNSIRDLAMCGHPWAADNDALNGLDVDAYLHMLDTIRQNDMTRLLFITAPDAAEMTPTGPRVSWDGTLWLWRSWRTALLNRGMPLAIVLQDGATADTVPWDDVQAVFVGGSDAWKDGPAAAQLATEARRREKWIHVGRINTQRRERLWFPLCESFDGTQYSRWPDTHIPACLERLAAGQRGMVALWEQQETHA